MDPLISVVLVAALQSVGAHGQGLAQRGLHDGSRLFVATSDSFVSGVGALVEVTDQDPWTTQVTGATAGGRVLRSFGNTVYVIDEQPGSITRVRKDGTTLPALDLGAGSLPQDILVNTADSAFVTRLNGGDLLRIDLVTGTSTIAADLRPFAQLDETLNLRMMHADGDHLFVQMGFFDPVGNSRGALAVFDMSTELLVDADPLQAGVQAIELAGAPPHLKMQIRGRRLFVSSTLYRMDSRGGIEMVDLDQLASIGFALTEKQVSGIDLGGFVLTGDDAGYFVFHTDIAASSHLHRFTIAGGLTPGPDLITILGDAVESLTFDPVRHRLYLPTGFASIGVGPGVFVLNTLTDEVVPGSPFPVGMRAHDLILVR